MSTIKNPGPVVLAHAITLLLGGLVATGWVTIPSATINSIATTGAVLISFGLAAWARSQVTPANANWQARIEEIVAGAVQDVLSSQLNLSPLDPKTVSLPAVPAAPIVPTSQGPAPSSAAGPATTVPNAVASKS